jgi:polysaccharide transporter, PST family
MTRHYRERLFSNFLALGIIQGTNYLLPILVMPYVLKKIGAEGFGEVAVAQSVMAYFMTVADYGFNLTATRDVSLNRTNRATISKIFCAVLLTRLLVCAALFIVLILAVILIPYLHTYAALYILAFSTVIGQSVLMNWLFQGIEKMKIITYLTLLARLVFVVLVFTFIRTKADNIYFAFFTGVGNILAGLVSIVVAVRLLKLRLALPTGQELVAELRKGWHIMVSNLSVSSYTNINVLLLAAFTNDTVVGYYSVADKLIQAARQVLSVYFQAIYPQVCRMVTHTRQEIVQFFKSYYLPFLGAVFLGCLVLFIFPAPIAGFFLKSRQSLTSEYLRLMSFVPLIICLNIPAYQLLLAYNEKKRLMRVFISVTVVNIILNLVLVRFYGALGTSLVVIATEFLITSALYYELATLPAGRLVNIKNDNI